MTSPYIHMWQLCVSTWHPPTCGVCVFSCQPEAQPQCGLHTSNVSFTWHPQTSDSLKHPIYRVSTVQGNVNINVFT